jgi:hypothetical protein
MDHPLGRHSGDEDGALEHKGDILDSLGERYRIRLRGHLDRRWSGWFEGFDLVWEDDGTTVLTGPVADQPALHGLLIRIRDLGLAIVSICSLHDAGRPSGDPGDVR